MDPDPKTLSYQRAFEAISAQFTPKPDEARRRFETPKLSGIKIWQTTV
ncbi:MAG: hypothetical protein ACJASV_001937 [Pseudorhodobacter sp.]|jgi:hypothetical protein